MKESHPSLLSFHPNLQKLRRHLRNVWVPFLYPRHCPFCKIILPYGKVICADCQRKLPYVGGQTCLMCGKPVRDPHKALCYDCRIFPKSFQGGMALFLYNDITKQAMNDLKYNNRRRNADYFALAFYQYHRQRLEALCIDAIIPVPLHRNKQKKRGYNQAMLIADALSSLLNIPVYSSLLLRITDTMPQKELNPQARLNNLSKAFMVNPSKRTLSIINRLHSVLLVDDIYTSGATMESLSKLLHQTGIKKVYIASVCIGLSRD